MASTPQPQRTDAAPPSPAPEGARRDAPLHMTADEFRAAGHALVDRVAEFLAGVPARPVARDESPQQIHEALDASAPLPETDADADAALQAASTLLFEHSLLNGHPRFFGYITSSPAPLGMLGDLLAAAVNCNVGSWRLAPMATEIEAQTVRWIAELLGYEPSCGGLLVSGGNMANMVGLFAARAAAADWDVRVAGVGGPGARPLRVYASAETHTWLQKAADLSGLGTGAVRWIETDEALRMRPDALRDAIARDRAAGALPMMVIGTAGSVSTGAVDPLPEIARICREQGIWFHVDGAYGALAVAAADVPDDLRGLSLADSVAVDPHKWLYAPLEAGCVLVRDPERLRAAFAYHPPYYHFGQEATNFVDFGPQNSRGFRALKVWLALRQAGRSGYARMIGDDIALSRRMHQAVSNASGAGGSDAVVEHLDVSLRAGRPARDGRVGGNRTLPECAEPGAAGAHTALRRGVRVECGDRWPVPAAGMHRQLQHAGGGCGGGGRDRGAPGARDGSRAARAPESGDMTDLLPPQPPTPRARRIVITTLGSFGDVNPYVGLALGLKARGHRPVIATSASYRHHVEREGIGFRAVRPDVDPNDRALLAQVMDARAGTEFLLRDLVIPTVRDSHADLLEATVDADLLVTHPITFAGPIVAEQRRIPWVSSVLAPISFFSPHDLPVFPPVPAAKRLEHVPGAARLLVALAHLATRGWTDPVRQLRRELGLAPGEDPLFEGQHSPRLVLALFTGLLGRVQSDWPQNVRVTGPILYNGPAPHVLDPALERFLADGPPPVIFTLGSSAVSAAGDFYAVSAEAAHRAGVRAVLLTGAHPENRPDRLPEGVMIVEHAPHAALLPRGAATVHQGGIGTLQQAMIAGRPMLVVPYSHDQPDNAWRAEHLGIARTVRPPRYTVARVERELRALLDDPSYARRAHEVGASMRHENGVREACDAIAAVLEQMPRRRGGD